jgi:hypothetical protein
LDHLLENEQARAESKSEAPADHFGVMNKPILQVPFERIGRAPLHVTLGLGMDCLDKVGQICSEQDQSMRDAGLLSQSADDQINARIEELDQCRTSLDDARTAYDLISDEVDDVQSSILQHGGAISAAASSSLASSSQQPDSQLRRSKRKSTSQDAMQQLQTLYQDLAARQHEIQNTISQLEARVGILEKALDQAPGPFVNALNAVLKDFHVIRQRFFWRIVAG